MKKFNIFDIIILIVVACLCLVGYSVFEGKRDNENINAGQTVEFTVELKKCEKSVIDAISEGDTIYASLKGCYYGTVSGVEYKPATELVMDAQNGKFVNSSYEGLYDAYISISGEAQSVSDQHIMMGNQKIKVGLQSFLKSSKYVGTGYIVDVEVK